MQKHAWLTWLTGAACLGLFIAMQFDDGPAETLNERWGWQSAEHIYDGAYWALFTSMFVHGDLLHLTFNLYWLFQLGRRFEETFGSWKWLAFVASALLVTSTAQLALGAGSGLGASGVGYALFGFLWILRRQTPAFAEILDPKTASAFLIWLVACLVATFAGVVNVGNAAHLSGLAFGAAVAAWIGRPIPRPAAAAAIATIFVASVGSFFWAPWSFRWTSHQATAAYEREDYADAIRWYERSLQLGQDPTWCQQHIDLTRQILNRAAPGVSTNSSR